MEKVAEPIKISLAAARVNARKTQAQLAEEMEISRMTLANLENGKTQISKAQLHLFANYVIYQLLIFFYLISFQNENNYLFEEVRG